MVVIESSRLFSGLTPAEKEKLRVAAQIKTYPAKHQIFRQGDVGDGLYVVREGMVQISTTLGAGESCVLTRVGPGMFFGEMAVVDAEPRSASAVTEEPTAVYFVPSAAVYEMLEASPRLGLRMMKEFSQRMREVNRHYLQAVLQAERLTMVGRFARSIVHDFKNPLNVIGLAAELSSIEKINPGVRLHATQRIRKQVDRLTNMINELLEFTRGATTPKVLAQVNYAEYVSRLMEDLAAEMEERKINLVCLPAPNIFVLMDPQRLTHVFYNLIHNAVDAMPEGGEVRISFAVDGAQVRTEFEDTGEGIALEILPRLFEAFATHGKVQGTGLGLSICKKIIEDHQGLIEARNRPGGGAIISFTLPIARA